MSIFNVENDANQKAYHDAVMYGAGFLCLIRNEKGDLVLKHIDREDIMVRIDGEFQAF